MDARAHKDLRGSEKASRRRSPVPPLAIECRANGDADLAGRRHLGPGASQLGLSADASDSDGSVVIVGFYAGTTVLGTDSTVPYEFAWTNVPAGTYSLAVVALDNHGPVTVSSIRDITVSAGGTPFRAVFIPPASTTWLERSSRHLSSGIGPIGGPPLVSAGPRQALGH